MAIVSTYLPPKRVAHCIRVAETAEKLAIHYAADVACVRYAGLLHDVCKVLMPENLIEIGLPPDQVLAEFYDAFPTVWHAAVAPNLVKWLFPLVSTEAVLEAIRFHTTGKADMRLETAIIYVADFIEPERSGELAAKCRTLAVRNLDHAIFTIAYDSLKGLVEKIRPIHPDSVMCFNHYYLKLAKKDRKELTRLVQKS